jgi:hypothetical protein
MNFFLISFVLFTIISSFLLKKKDDTFKPTITSANILVCEGEADFACIRIHEFAISNNYTFNCYNNFIQIDFLTEPDNSSTKATGFLHYDGIVDSDTTASTECSPIKP